MQTPLHISFLYLKGSGSLKIPIVSSLIPVDLYIHWNAFVFCLLLSLRGLQFQYADYFVFESWDSFPCLLMIFVLIYQKLKGLPENAFRMSYCQKQAATPFDYNITKLVVTDKTAILLFIHCGILESSSVSWNEVRNYFLIYFYFPWYWKILFLMYF